MYAIYRRRLGMTPEILEADVSQQNLKFREQYWIDEYGRRSIFHEKLRSKYQIERIVSKLSDLNHWG